MRELISALRAHECVLGVFLGLPCAWLLATPCAAQEANFALSFPVECEIGKTCMVQNYFDHDPGPGVKDYACGFLSYNGHDGSDIRLPNLAAMRQGYRVLAAASGKVRATRDEVDDVSVRDSGRDTVRGREAGNSVAIDHGNGWETQYSHLRKGSVRVKPGEPVKRGQPLGLVGLSGLTEFPHLHLTVRLNGAKIDPFTGPGEHKQCGLGARPVWDPKTLAALRYSASGLLDAGFAGDAVTFQQVKGGGIPVPGMKAPALVFWVDIYGAQTGDEEHLRIFASDGKQLVEKRGKLPGNKAESFSYVGRKRPGASWPAGTYRGEYVLTRVDKDGPQAVVSLVRELRIVE